ncbi:14729_t:CDS:2, partial [Entrophospora sp. SA101]
LTDSLDDDDEFEEPDVTGDEEVEENITEEQKIVLDFKNAFDLIKNWQKMVKTGTTMAILNYALCGKHINDSLILGQRKHGKRENLRTSRWKPRLATVDLVYMRIWKNYNMFKGATAAGRLCAGMKKHVMWCKDWETVNDSISTGSVHPDSNIVARLSNCQNPLKPK